jgi:hypothetical protein
MFALDANQERACHPARYSTDLLPNGSHQFFMSSHFFGLSKWMISMHHTARTISVVTRIL